MQVKLTRKLADHLDGIDLSGCLEGDVLDLPRHNAELLIAEHWAIPVANRDVRGTSPALLTDRAQDAPSRRIRLFAGANRKK